MAYYHPSVDPEMNIIVDEDCPLITIVGIGENVVGSCEYPSGGTCTATHTFFADIKDSTGSIDYQWGTDKGIIVGGTTDSTFVVELTDNKNVTMNITLTVGDSLSGDTKSVQVISKHTLNNLTDCIFAFTDGVWNGYEENTYGILNPETTFENIYAIKWKEDSFVIRLGATGESKILDVDIIDVSYLGRYYQAVWNPTDMWYDTDEVDLLTDLSNKYEACERQYCFSLFFLANLVISTGFEELV